MKYHEVAQKIQDLLNQNGVIFDTFEHEPVRTSEEASKVRTGYTIEQGAKALIARVKKEGTKVFVMIVVPGNAKFDKDKLKNNFGLSDVRFATSEEAVKITGGVEFGGIPPLGNIFGLEVYADRNLLKNERIIFNAGDRSFSIGMKSEDYISIAKPNIGDIVAE
ncbi:MAG: YbaK/EbsC family protein [Patescibacteria group bacterium]